MNRIDKITIPEVQALERTDILKMLDEFTEWINMTDEQKINGMLYKFYLSVAHIYKTDVCNIPLIADQLCSEIGRRVFNNLKEKGKI